jgi:hypothetical protein
VEFWSGEFVLSTNGASYRKKQKRFLGSGRDFFLSSVCFVVWMAY